MIAKKEREKCPYCGRAMNKIDYSGGIKNLTLARSKKTMELIEDAVRGISELSKDPVKQSEYYMLLKEIEGITGIVVRKMVRSFTDKKYAERGNGIYYLLAMIKGEHSAHALRVKYETETLDRLPPVKERDK